MFHSIEEVKKDIKELDEDIELLAGTMVSGLCFSLQVISSYL